MTKKSAYGNHIDVPVDFEKAVDQITGFLKEEGFGVLTEIDVKETLKKKLDIDFRKYKILGACNPPLAHKALAADDFIGLLLPCNVIVYDIDGEKSRIAVIDPVEAMKIAANEKIEPVAKEVQEKLNRVLEKTQKFYI
jgi:uncharacterized protein (DUF302 family)